MRVFDLGSLHCQVEPVPSQQPRATTNRTRICVRRRFESREPDIPVEVIPAETYGPLASSEQCDDDTDDGHWNGSDEDADAGSKCGAGANPANYASKERKKHGQPMEHQSSVMRE
jgi:hypothetical protein